MDIKKLVKIFLLFLKIGSSTFGGGLAILPILRDEFVVKRNWLTEEEIVDIFAVSQSLPGTIALNGAVFVGARTGGIVGAILAVAGIIIPSVLSVVVIIGALSVFKGNVYIDKAMGGIRSAMAALIMLAAIKMGKTAIRSYLPAIIALVSFLLIILMNFHPIYTILMGAFIGIVLHIINLLRKNWEVTEK